MSKYMSVALKAWLYQSALSEATLVRVDRKDGLTLGFTSWDVPLVYAGTTFWPNVSLSTSAIKTSSDLTTDQMDIIGAIDSVLITEADIDAGRYDSALITVMICNPLDLSMGVRTDLVGYAGQITYGELGLTVAANSIGTKANQQFGDIITPTCRVRQLGDFQCKVNLASYQFSSAVLSVTSAIQLRFTDSQVTGYYDYGLVRFKSVANGGGLNHNLTMEIKTHLIVGGQADITLQEPMPFLVGVGDTAILEAGCDRKSSTCRSKFSNLVNIHAEPYVPGNDSLLKTGRPPS